MPRQLENYVFVGYDFASVRNRLSGDAALYRRRMEFSPAPLQKPENSHREIVSHV